MKFKLTSYLNPIILETPAKDSSMSISDYQPDIIPEPAVKEGLGDIITSHVRPDLDRPYYKVKFRHVNCRHENQFHPECQSTVYWYPDRLFGQSYEELINDFNSQSHEIYCCGSGTVGSPKYDRHVPQEGVTVERMGMVAQVICDAGYECISRANIVRGGIVWENRPPKTLRGKAVMIHDKEVTRSHLELMHYRNAKDYILIDFMSFHDDEDTRRGRMLKALSKLSRKASSHCNR